MFYHLNRITILTLIISTTFEPMPSLKLQLTASNVDYANSNTTVQIGAKYVSIALAQNSVINSFELFEISEANSISQYQECFAQSSLLKNISSKCNVVFNASEFLLVPNAKFSVVNIDSYLASTYGDADSKTIINCTDDSLLGKLSIHIIYRIKSDLYEAVNKYCSNAKYLHATTIPVINLFNSQQTIYEKLKIQFYQSSMLVMVIYNNQLKLVQTYNYNSPEDILYYLLNILQEFSLNVESTFVEVSGLIDINSQHFLLLQSLFSKLSLEAVNNQPLFTNSVPVANAHYYTPFINAAL